MVHLRPLPLLSLLAAACTPAPSDLDATDAGPASTDATPTTDAPASTESPPTSTESPPASTDTATGGNGPTGSATTTTPTTTSDATSGDAPTVASTGAPEEPTPDFPAATWLFGQAPEVVSGPDLQALPGGLAGPPICVSNNPEPFKGVGWLSQTARTDPERGGAPTPLDTGVLYLFHINHSGAARTMHVLATNPNADPIVISGRGSVYNNVERPLQGAGTGPSHAVALDWEQDALALQFSDLAIAPGKAVELARSSLAANNMVDGRLEFSASAGVYLYTVVTASGLLADAINLSQGPGASGTLAMPGPNAYGREAGVYASSRWEAAPLLEVPLAPAYLGIMLNTSDKFAFGGAQLQDQTAPALMHLSDSSDRSHGNYGHRFELGFSLCNPDAAPRTVRLRFASHKTGPVDEPSQTWNGPVRVDGAVIDVSTRPTAPSQTLGTWPIEPGACRPLAIGFYVPGLITGGQQLVFESI